MKIGDKVHVWWVDSAVSHPGWVHLEDIKNRACKCESSGWLVKKSKKRITVAGHKCNTGQYDGIITIPRVAIKRIKRVKL